MKRRPAVRWLSPWTLLSLLHATYRGRRNRSSSTELDDGKPISLGEPPHTSVGGFDFVSDTGDGFDATATVAWSLAQPDLQIDDVGVLARGDGLVHGGDMVYPAGTDRAYQERFVGIMESVLPLATRADSAPWFLAIPGNHDRFDGLRAWRRVVAGGAPVGGWTTSQTQPWFAHDLSPRWVLWGVSRAQGAAAERQLSFFRERAPQLVPGTAVVLVVPAPIWSQSGHTELDALYRELVALIDSAGASVRIWLTGDEHNYHRYRGSDGAQYLTAGGGGAFLSTTHRLQDSVKWNGATLELADSVYPSREVTSAMRWKAPQMVLRNGALPLLLGGLYAVIAVLLGVSSQLAALTLASVVTLGSTWAFTRSSTARGFAVAVAHALGHCAVFAVLAALDIEPMATRVAVFAAAGAMVAPLLVSGGLMLGSAVGINDNELFSALRIDDYGCFLRCQLRDDDSIAIHAVGIDSIVREWDEAGGALTPAFPPVVRLLEEPVVVFASS